MIRVAYFKTILRNAHPGKESRTTAFLAHGAMTVGYPVAGQLDGKLNGPTQTISTGGCHGSSRLIQIFTVAMRLSRNTTPPANTPAGDIARALFGVGFDTGKLFYPACRYRLTVKKSFRTVFGPGPAMNPAGAQLPEIAIGT